MSAKNILFFSTRRLQQFSPITPQANEKVEEEDLNKLKETFLEKITEDYRPHAKNFLNSRDFNKFLENSQKWTEVGGADMSLLKKIQNFDNERNSNKSNPKLYELKNKDRDGEYAVYAVEELQSPSEEAKMTTDGKKTWEWVDDSVNVICAKESSIKQIILLLHDKDLPEYKEGMPWKVIYDEDYPHQKGDIKISLGVFNHDNDCYKKIMEKLEGEKGAMDAFKCAQKLFKDYSAISKLNKDNKIATVYAEYSKTESSESGNTAKE